MTINHPCICLKYNTAVGDKFGLQTVWFISDILFNRLQTKQCTFTSFENRTFGTQYNVINDMIVTNGKDVQLKKQKKHILYI